MKGKDLIKVIQDNELEDFDIQFIYQYLDDSYWGYAVDTYKAYELEEIGYSEKVACISIDIVD